MIKIQPKPIEEITDIAGSYKKILIVGCGGCASVCLGGGQPEVDKLTEILNLNFEDKNAPNRAKGCTIERQCNKAFIEELENKVPEYDCVFSMACGAGAQYIAEVFPGTPVFPAVNTVSIGIDREIGVYEERCRACGECVLSYTGGICPVTRCAKGLFNGPCGGTNRDECEIGRGIPCAWLAIYNRLKEQDRLDDIHKLRAPMEWQNQTLRTLVQEF